MVTKIISIFLVTVLVACVVAQNFPSSEEKGQNKKHLDDDNDGKVIFKRSMNLMGDEHDQNDKRHLDDNNDNKGNGKALFKRDVGDIFDLMGDDESNKGEKHILKRSPGGPPPPRGQKQPAGKPDDDSDE